MAGFWQYLTVQILLTERKTSLITAFLQLLKIWQKRLETFESDKGKVEKIRKEKGERKGLAQIFRKDLTERKLERTRIKIMLSASLSLVFSHKVPNIRFENQTCILPN